MKEILLLIDADYILSDGKAVVRLFCKDKNKNTIVVLDDNFLPYFYIMPKGGKENLVKEKVERLDTKGVDAKILKVEKVNKSWKGEDRVLVKVTIDNPRRVKDVRDLVKEWEEVEDTYEYDIPFYKRYILDNMLTPMSWILVDGEEIEKGGYQAKKVIKASNVKPIDSKDEVEFNLMAFDTEWIEEDGKSKLIMLSIASTNGFKRVLTWYEWKGKPDFVEIVKDEKELIERFIDLVREKDPDFLVGYNSDGFDFPKLKEKETEFKMKINIGRDDSPIRVVRRGRVSSSKLRGRVHIDLFNFINHILAPSLKTEVLTLDEVAQELIGVGKKEMKYKEMVEIWSKKDQMERLAEYSLWDSELTLKLAEYLLPQIFAISRLTGLLPFDASRNTYSQLVEAFYTRKAVESNVLIPNRPKTEEIERRRMLPVYKGAIVIEPKKGIHSDISVFDFRSLYPTIIVTYNISPETFNCNHEECREKNKVPENEWHFCLKKKGFIPTYLEELIKERQEIKKRMKSLKKDSKEWKELDNMQYALKIIANATYGYFGFFAAKWYKRECGASAAAWGRFHIKGIVEFAKKDGFEIIYGDTDSLFVKINVREETTEKKKIELLKERSEEFVKKVNKQLPGIIELEFRGLYKAGIFVARKGERKGAKKRYALIDYDGNLEIRGFETVRRDWCELAKRIQREVLVKVLKEKSPEKAAELVRETIKMIKEGRVSLEDLIIYEQITRPLSEYEQIGPHVRAAQKARARGRLIGEGSVIGFVITKGSGSISERAEPVEDVRLDEYDPEYYINHQVLPASMRVLSALGYSERDILVGKVRGLKSFFKNS